MLQTILIEYTLLTFQLAFSHTFDAALEATDCVYISIRTHNLAGLYSTTRHPLVGCTVESKEELIVIDGVGEFDEDAHDYK